MARRSFNTSKVPTFVIVAFAFYALALLGQAVDWATTTSTSPTASDMTTASPIKAEQPMNKPEFEFIFGLLNKQATPIVSFPAAPVAVDLPISIDVSNVTPAIADVLSVLLLATAATTTTTVLAKEVVIDVQIELTFSPINKTVAVAAAADAIFPAPATTMTKSKPMNLPVCLANDTMHMSFAAAAATGFCLLPATTTMEVGAPLDAIVLDRVAWPVCLANETVIVASTTLFVGPAPATITMEVDFASDVIVPAPVCAWNQTLPAPGMCELAAPLAVPLAFTTTTTIPTTEETPEEADMDGDVSLAGPYHGPLARDELGLFYHLGGFAAHQFMAGLDGSVAMKPLLPHFATALENMMRMQGLKKALMAQKIMSVGHALLLEPSLGLSADGGAEREVSAAAGVVVSVWPSCPANENLAVLASAAEEGGLMCLVVANVPTTAFPRAAEPISLPQCPCNDTAAFVAFEVCPVHTALPVEDITITTDATDTTDAPSSFMDEVIPAAAVAAHLKGSIDALAKRERVALAISAFAQLAAFAAAQEKKQLETTLALFSEAEPVFESPLVLPAADAYVNVPSAGILIDDSAVFANASMEVDEVEIEPASVLPSVMTAGEEALAPLTLYDGLVVDIVIMPLRGGEWSITDRASRALSVYLPPLDFLPLEPAVAVEEPTVRVLAINCGNGWVCLINAASRAVALAPSPLQEATVVVDIVEMDKEGEGEEDFLFVVRLGEPGDDMRVTDAASRALYSYSPRLFPTTRMYDPSATAPISVEPLRWAESAMVPLFAVEEETNYDEEIFGLLPFVHAVMVSRFEREEVKGEGSSVEPPSTGNAMVVVVAPAGEAPAVHKSFPIDPSSPLEGEESGHLIADAPSLDAGDDAEEDVVAPGNLLEASEVYVAPKANMSMVVPSDTYLTSAEVMHALPSLSDVLTSVRKANLTNPGIHIAGAGEAAGSISETPAAPRVAGKGQKWLKKIVAWASFFVMICYALMGGGEKGIFSDSPATTTTNTAAAATTAAAAAAASTAPFPQPLTPPSLAIRLPPPIVIGDGPIAGAAHALAVSTPGGGLSGAGEMGVVEEEEDYK